MVFEESAMSMSPENEMHPKLPPYGPRVHPPNSSINSTALICIIESISYESLKVFDIGKNSIVYPKLQAKDKTFGSPVNVPRGKVLQTASQQVKDAAIF